MIRNDVAAVLKRPISNVDSFTHILEAVSRDTGNTQRVMRDLIAVILTKLEELEQTATLTTSATTAEYIPHFTLSPPVEEEVEAVTTKYEPKRKVSK